MMSSGTKPKAEEMRPRLGRGLAALIGDAGPEPEAIVRSKAQRRMPIEFLAASPRNPRLRFHEEELAELAATIKERGIIQPILVRNVPAVVDRYEIVAGERRWRAAQLAGLHEVPVVLIEADDKQALEIAIIENVQRSDLNAMEEAQGYESLMEEFEYSQSDLAKVIGKSRPHVNNTLRLLKLPDPVREMVLSNAISAGHARALLGSEDPAGLAQKVVEKGLSVRAVEDLVKRENRGFLTQDEREAHERKLFESEQRRKSKDPDTRALEKRLGDKTGLFVDIRHKGDSGEVRVKYASLEQLDALVALLGA